VGLRVLAPLALVVVQVCEPVGGAVDEEGSALKARIGAATPDGRSGQGS